MRQTTVYLIAAAIIAFGLVAGFVAGAVMASTDEPHPATRSESTTAV